MRPLFLRNAPAWPMAHARTHLNLIAVANGTVFVSDNGRSGVDATGIYTIPVGATSTPFTTLHAGPPFTSLRGIVALADGTVYVVDGKTIWSVAANIGIR